MDAHRVRIFDFGGETYTVVEITEDCWLPVIFTGTYGEIKHKSIHKLLKNDEMASLIRISTKFLDRKYPDFEGYVVDSYPTHLKSRV